MIYRLTVAFMVAMALLICLSGCVTIAGQPYQVSFNGVPLNEVPGAIKPPPLNLKGFLGATASAVAHAGGHHLVGNLMGFNVRQDGGTEFIDEPMTALEAALFGIGGSGTQLFIGWGMKIAGCNNDFTLGFNYMTVLETSLYPFFDPYLAEGSDMELIGRYTNEYLVWALGTAAALPLIMEEKENNSKVSVDKTR